MNTVFSKEQADILMSWAISILIAVTLCSVKNFYDTYIVKERQAFGFASQGWAYYKMFVRPRPYIFHLLASCLVNK